MEKNSSKKLIFVLLDGLGAETARKEMGFMAALSESGKAFYQTMECELPALSRPLYHCIFTGEAPVVSGITHNFFWKPRHTPTFFALARQKGLTTAASAYFWVSELCNIAPYNPLRDRFVNNAEMPIAHGVFYDNDAYPDDCVFQDAEILRMRYKAELLLIHSMGIDNAGHLHGADSAEYRVAANTADMLLARYAPPWLEDGCTVIVTSDHGMDGDGKHNGNNPRARDVPLWIISPDMRVKAPGSMAQTDLCGLARGILGI